MCDVSTQTISPRLNPLIDRMGGVKFAAHVEWLLSALDYSHSYCVLALSTGKTDTDGMAEIAKPPYLTLVGTTNPVGEIHS